jgi:alkylation response protein AidB-like acyl-CoA dehydrogenase
MRTGTKEARSPPKIDMAAAKIEVARTYGTGDVSSRIDDRVASVRDKMKETRAAMLKALMRRTDWPAAVNDRQCFGAPASAGASFVVSTRLLRRRGLFRFHPGPADILALRIEIDRPVKITSFVADWLKAICQYSGKESLRLSC